MKRQYRLAEFPALENYLHTMCQIPDGTFQMGTNNGLDDEKPVHNITLSSFSIGTAPVTVAVWKEYCSSTGTVFPPAPPWGWLDDHPIVCVSWDDIMGLDGRGGFCAWANVIAGMQLTLPTEAQWEYAARSAGCIHEFPWGDAYRDSMLWCSNCTCRKSTAPVRRTSNIYRNKYGLTDMAGNVWEWCSILHGPHDGNLPVNPVEPSLTSDNRRCVRGGSWLYDEPDVFKCAYRREILSDDWVSNLGFRLSGEPG